MTDEVEFRNADLRGRSFVDAELDHADFTGADLRGTDLSGATLRNARLVDAKLGLRPLASGALFAAAILIVAGTGWVIGWTLRSLTDGLTNEAWEEVFDRGLALVVIGSFILLVVAFGLVRALKYGAILFVAATVLSYVVVALTTREFDLARDAQVIGVVLVLASALIAGGLARVVGGTFATWSIVVVGLAGGVAAGQGGGGVAGIVVSVTLVVLAKRALRNDERDDFARRLVHRIVARRGTRFIGADLQGADFTGSVVAHSDFTGATLDGADFDRISGFPPVVDRPGG